MTRFINFDEQFFDNSTGAPVALGTVYFGQPNQDPKTNPKAPVDENGVDLDPIQALTSSGKFVQDINFPAGESYSYIVEDADNNQIDEQQEVSGSDSVSGEDGSSKVGYLPGGTGAVPTNVQDKLREFVSIEDFGAIGNDATNNFTAIDLCNDYCTLIGATMWIPDGIFLCNSQVAITCDVDGVGTIKTGTQIGNGRQGVFSLEANKTIRNISFNCNSLSAAITCQTAASSYATIENVKADLAYRAALGTDALGTAEIVGVTIRGCHITNTGQGEPDFGDGILAVQAKDWIIDGNTIDGFTRIGIVTEGNSDPTEYSTNPIITNNVILNGQSGTPTLPLAGIWCENTNGGTITGNNIDNIVNSTVPWEAYGITIGGFRSGAPTPVNQFVIRDNKINDVRTGIKEGGGLVEGNSITNFRVGMDIGSGGVNTHLQKRFFKNNYMGDATFVFTKDGYYDGVGSTNPPNCLFLLRADGNSEIVIDGLELENIDRGSEATISDIFVTNQLGPTDPAKTTISADVSDNSFNDSAASFSSAVGDTIVTSGFVDPANNGRFLVTSATASKLIVTEGTLNTEAAGASVTIDRPDTFKSLEVKNVKYDQDLVYRCETANRVRRVLFENCPVGMALGARIRAWDEIRYKECDMSRNIPSAAADFTIRCDKLIIEGNRTMFGGNVTTSGFTTGLNGVILRILDNDAGPDFGNRAFKLQIGSFVHVTNNTLNGYSTALVETIAANTCKANFVGNNLINNNGGALIVVNNATDTVAINSTTKDDATATFTNPGGGTVTEANTVTL